MKENNQAVERQEWGITERRALERWPEAEKTFGRMFMEATWNIPKRSRNRLWTWVKSEQQFVEIFIQAESVVHALGGWKGVGKNSLPHILEWWEDERSSDSEILAYLNEKETMGQPMARVHHTLLDDESMPLIQEILNEGRAESEVISFVPMAVKNPMQRRLSIGMALTQLLDFGQSLRPNAFAGERPVDPMLRACLALDVEGQVDLRTQLICLGVFADAVDRLVKCRFDADPSLEMVEKWVRGKERRTGMFLVWGLVERFDFTFEQSATFFNISENRVKYYHKKVQSQLTTIAAPEELQHVVASKPGRLMVLGVNGAPAEDLGEMNRHLCMALKMLPGEILPQTDEGESSAIWLSEFVKHDWMARVLRFVELNGRDWSGAKQLTVDFFHGAVDADLVWNALQPEVENLVQDDVIVQNQILAALAPSKRALSLSEIVEFVDVEHDTEFVRSQLTKLIRTHHVVAIGKRGYYMRRIPGFDGTSYTYANAALHILIQCGQSTMLAQEIFETYKKITGIDADFNSFQMSISSAEKAGTLPVEVLPFDFLGLPGRNSWAQRLKVGVSFSQIKSELNRFHAPFPKRGTWERAQLSATLAEKLRVPQKLIELAVRKWQYLTDQGIAY